MSGGDTPGGLPLISRFSRSPGWQPVGRPVNLPAMGGTLILVNRPGPIIGLVRSLRYLSLSSLLYQAPPSNLMSGSNYTPFTMRFTSETQSSQRKPWYCILEI
jgi:hypothetical protein